MENRFGVRDLIHVVLILTVIAAVIVTMYQIDRQWHAMMDMREQMARQADFSQQLFKEQKAQAENPQIVELREELVKLRQTLERGVVVAGAAARPDQAAQEGQAGQADEDGIVWGPAIGRDVDPFARVKAAAAQADYRQGGHIVDVFAVLPDRLTPLISTDVYGSMIQDKVLESLATRDPDTLQWTPQVARWWRISEDGLHIEFELRTNVVFSDGVALTADDVVFTFEWIMNPQVEAPRTRAYYEKVQSVTRTGPHRVRFSFKEPYFKAFELAGGLSILPKHFYSQYTPEQFNRSTGLLLGSGAYRLTNPTTWRPEPGKPIEVVRNELYWGPAAPFDRILWRVISDDSTRLTAFRNRETDMLYPTPEQYLLMLKDRQLLDRTQHFEFDRPTAGYLFVAWAQIKQGKPTLFADARVRKAMTLLIDRQRICQEIFQGYASPVTGPFSPLSPQSDPAIEPWPFDIAQAQAILAQAGYRDTNNDGILDTPDGKPLTFKLSYPSASETFNRVVLLMKDNFARAGVLLVEDPLEWNVLLQRINQRELDAYSLGWSGQIESDPYQIFHSSQIAGTGDNSVGYANPELDKLLEQARVTVDQDQRMAMWRQVHRILHDDQPYTFLLTRRSLIFADQRFRNIKPTRIGLTPQLEWYVPAAGQ